MASVSFTDYGRKRENIVSPFSLGKQRAYVHLRVTRSRMRSFRKWCIPLMALQRPYPHILTPPLLLQHREKVWPIFPFSCDKTNFYFFSLKIGSFVEFETKDHEAKFRKWRIGNLEFYYYLNVHVDDVFCIIKSPE